MDVTFIPKYIECFEESDGFVKASKYLDKYFGNEYPSELEMAKQLLINECFLSLPFNYCEEEGILLANTISYYVLNLMDEKLGDEFLAKEHIESEHLMNLHCLNIEI